MSFSDAIKTCLKEKYCCFEGRARRSEYWFFCLFNMIVSFAISAITGIIGSDTLATILSTAVSLAIFLPGLGVAVRRMHDVGKSGWYLLMSLIPFVGAILVIIKLATEGDAGPNEYGPDPRGEFNGFAGNSPDPYSRSNHSSSGSGYYNNNGYTDEIIDAVEKDRASAAKFCTSCGAPLSPGQKFCNNCGAKVE